MSGSPKIPLPSMPSIQDYTPGFETWDSPTIAQRIALDDAMAELFLEYPLDKETMSPVEYSKTILSRHAAQAFVHQGHFDLAADSFSRSHAGPVEHIRNIIELLK